MQFEYKNVLIYGYGVSGKSAEKLLQSNNIGYKIYDKHIHQIEAKFLPKLNKIIIKQFDLIVLSPGVSIYDKYVKIAKKLGTKVIGEIELAYNFLNTKIIGVTGTNGKTSTVKLITDILNNFGLKAGCYGNIGTPLSECVGKDIDYCVCEISSFQLESIDKFRCDIAVILNIDNDHLDRHKTLDNYINCKLRIAKNSAQNDVIILNADDKTIMKNSSIFAGKMYYISALNKVEGVYLKNNSIYYNNGDGISQLFDCKDIQHSMYLENIMSAVCVAKIVGVDNETIFNTLKTWDLMPHRLELVTKSCGVTYIDDSKSTNAHSVKNAIKCTNGNIVLMLGGENKALKFDSLFSEFHSRFRVVIAFGKSRNYFYRLAKKSGVTAYRFKHMKDAIIFANHIAENNDTVLLSPGCASFDEFASYAERGEVFKKIVLDLVKDEKQKD